MVIKCSVHKFVLKLPDSSRSAHVARRTCGGTVFRSCTEDRWPTGRERWLKWRLFCRVAYVVWRNHYPLPVPKHPKRHPQSNVYLPQLKYPYLHWLSLTSFSLPLCHTHRSSPPCHTFEPIPCLPLQRPSSSYHSVCMWWDREWRTLSALKASLTHALGSTKLIKSAELVK